MAVTKAQKQKILAGLKEKVDKQKSIALASIAGVKVKDLTRLRREMKKQDCELKVAKKTLISLAFKGKKIDIDTKKLEGEVALSFGYRDEVLPFRILYDFARENENLKILGGLIGKELLTREKAVELAQLPSKEELLARLVGSVASPITGLINVLQGNIKGLMYALSAIKK